MENPKISVGKKYRLDIIFISIILAISLLTLLIFSLTKKEGAYAVVEIDGKTVVEYPLYMDGEYILNGGTNTLVISGGAAYMINSECPDHTCENTGKIRYVGQTIVCLPNRLSITIKGEGESVDLIS